MIKNLIDTLNIEVYSGAGGDGVISFRKLKTKKRAIPDGGNGGRGGDVYFRGQERLDDLHHLNGHALRATAGKPGRKSNKTGENGTALVIDVPLGTRILDRNAGHLLLEVNDSTRHLLLAGGKPGYGNAGSHHHSATQGEAGSHLALTLDYRLPADVGIVGFTNTGKSTLLSRISSARPLIDSYPLTTRSPQVGICDPSTQLDNFFGQPLTVVEIPALATDNSHATKFLKHLLRTKLIIYSIAANATPLQQQFTTLQELLSAYDEGLYYKAALIIVSHYEHPPKHIISAATRIDVVPMPNTASECVALQQKIVQLWERSGE